MPDLERLQLPLRPSGHTLASHIAALDLLATRLDSLPSRSRWPARVPINSKASFDGDVVHTNEVKVKVSGDWWVEMTAHQAADYVRQRKATMLEEHARLTEGQSVEPSVGGKPSPEAGQRVLRMSEMTFDPLLAHPAPAQPPQGERLQQQQSEATSSPPNSEPASSEPSAPVTRLVDDGNEVDLPQSLQSLVDLVGEHLHDKLRIPNGGDSTVNEEGEPIYEIREDGEGRPLGPVPEGKGEGSEEVGEGPDDYFSPEAVERRAALRRRIFHEGDSSSDEEDGMDVDTEKQPIGVDTTKDAMDIDAEDEAVTPQATRQLESLPPVSQTHILVPEIKSTPTTPTQLSYPSVHSSPSTQRSPAAPPKSILKAPVRKKSVTFDESVPIPPDSPPPKRHGFPLDEMIASTRPVDAQGLPSKVVPILKAPLPGRKKAPDTFGGLRTGFLGSASPIVPLVPQFESAQTVDLSRREPPARQATPVKEAAKMQVEEKTEPPAKKASPPPKEPAKMQVEEKIEPPAKEEKMDEDPVPEDKPKKKSLFAQRRSTPSFPKQSDTAPMSTMKGAVVEAPTAPRQTGVPPTVGSASTEAPMVIVDDDSDLDDYGDLGEFSDDEEDEYALDEALLAREVALEFHRRQAWTKPVDEDDFDPEAPNVVMGIPRVSTITGGEDDPLRIVNPTADDLSQFLRVGRGEDGELVFEQPVINSESESEGEDDGEAAKDRRERRARRKDVMRRLMSGEYEELPPPSAPQLRAEEYHASLPPTVGSVQPQPESEPEATASIFAPSPPAPTAGPAPPKPGQPPATRDVVERSAADAPAAAAPTPPKKVSRFKAARTQ